MSYESLERVLQMAYVQASTGKGHERHGDARPLGEQISFVIEKHVESYLLWQAVKKIVESQRLDRLDKGAVIRKLLGAIAINYIAMRIIALRWDAADDDSSE